MVIDNSPPRFPRIAVDVDPTISDDISVNLFDMGATGVEVRDSTTPASGALPNRVTLLASFASNSDADLAIGQLNPQDNPRRDDVVGDAWRDSWREHFRPFHLTARIVVQPPWYTYEARDGEHVLVMDPGRAFGTGLHPTTRLVARSLEDAAGKLQGSDVLDVGCGSGVLGFCALMMGALRVRAVDIDPDAVMTTRENAERNGFSDRVVVDGQNVAAINASYPVVLANIEARVLAAMASNLKECVASEGLLILSGVLEEQADEVVAAFEGMSLVRILRDTGWVAIELTLCPCELRKRQ